MNIAGRKTRMSHATSRLRTSQGLVRSWHRVSSSASTAPLADTIQIADPSIIATTG